MDMVATERNRVNGSRGEAALLGRLAAAPNPSAALPRCLRSLACKPQNPPQSTYRSLATLQRKDSYF